MPRGSAAAGSTRSPWHGTTCRAAPATIAAVTEATPLPGRAVRSVHARARSVTDGHPPTGLARRRHRPRVGGRCSPAPDHARDVQAVVRGPVRGRGPGGDLLGGALRHAAEADRPVQRLPLRHHIAAGGDGGGGGQPHHPQVADCLRQTTANVVLGRLQRRQRLLQWSCTTSGTTRRRSRTCSRARADSARDRVRPVAERAGSPDLPCGPADPSSGARFPRRLRRTARRHHEGPPRMARERRHRVAARAVAKVKRSMDYCIATWDPGHKGVLEEPHHNTTTSSSGSRRMCTSFYLGASRRWTAWVGRSRGHHTYAELRDKGAKFAEETLFNGEYFIQKISGRTSREEPGRVAELRQRLLAEAIELLKKEGRSTSTARLPLRRVLGAGSRRCAGWTRCSIAGRSPATCAPCAATISRPICLRTPTAAPVVRLRRGGRIAVVQLAKGGKLSLPFVYSDEVWTGIEYQVALT